ncbi:SapC family protein [Marinomonas gallaica]|uniref:SapC family protein n=1 Tax=Marinomonas gallaica TaxID=1806667 RepID=UPI003CE5C01F
MPNWQALSKEKHAKSGWVAPSGYPQAKQDSIASVLAAELGQVLPYYPLAFVSDGKDSYHLNAMLSLESNTNLFINSANQWMVPYIPAAFRSYPFQMMSNGSGGHILALDVESDFFLEEAVSPSQRILTDDGEPNESMKPLITFMQQRLSQKIQTDTLVKQLADLNLIEPWSIDVRFGPEESDVRKLLGLSRINEKALQELAPESLSELAKSGALGIAYAQLFSMARVKDLQTRYLQYLQQTKKPEVAEVDLDKLFDGDDGNDVFSF